MLRPRPQPRAQATLDLVVSPSEFALDEEQASAARAPLGRNVVLAGAGTGKTRTLVGRILHLIEGGADPTTILCVTFTRRAAAEIAARIAQAYPGERQPVVGTFHSVASRILRRHGAVVGVPRSFVLVDDEEMHRILSDILREDEPKRDVKDLGRRIDGWKAAGLTASRARASQPEDPRTRRDVEHFLRLHDEMRARKLLEFSDLVVEATEAMSADDDVRVTVAGSVVHLLVDETQDANPAQARFVQALASVHGDVFAVGDEDQSIYSFQGGGPSGIFAVAGPGAKVWSLTHNRRSTDEILAPAIRLVGLNRRSVPKVLVSGVSGAVPTYETFPTEMAEAHHVAERVGALVRSGVDPAQIAILARASYVVPKIEEAMIRAGIAYEVYGGTPFFRREEVRDVCAYLRLAIDPNDDVSFRRIANKPTRGIGPATEDALVRMAQEQSIPFHEACARLRSVDGARIAVADGIVAMAEPLYWLSFGHDRQEWSASRILEYVLGPMGLNYEAYATKDKTKARRRRDMLAILRRMASEEDEVLLLLERIALSTEEAELDDGPRAPKVRIATMHSSKGLEWDHVFVVAFERGVVPAPKSNVESDVADFTDPWAPLPIGGVDEERRLSHVAFTRARRGLVVTGSQQRGDKKAGPSRFVSEAGFHGDPGAGLVPDPESFRKLKRQPIQKKRRNALF